MKKISLAGKVKLIVSLIAIAVLIAIFTIPAVGKGEGSLQIKNFSPQGEFSGRAEIKAVFTRDVVEADDTGRELSSEEMPFLFTPSLKGRARWTDTKTFVFTPAAISPATPYTATLLPGLKGVGDKKITGKKSFEFYTKPLRFLGASLINYNSFENNALYELSFSHPVSPSRLRGYIDVKPLGRFCEYKVLDGPASRKVRIMVDTDGHKGEQKLTVADGLPCEAGPLGLEKSVTVQLADSGKVEITNSFANTDIAGGEIYIETSAPADLSKIASYIEVSPKSAYTVEPRNEGFAIRGKFSSQDRVSVTLRKGLPSISGEPMETEWKRTFIFPDKRAEISFRSSGQVLTYKDSMRIPVDTVNIDRMQVSVWRLYENNIAHGMKNAWGSFPMELSDYITGKTYKVRSKRNETASSALDLAPLTQGKKGVYLVTAENEEGGEWARDSKVINVTDLGITFIQGATGAFFRVNSVRDGRPVKNAKVTMWTWANQDIGTGETARDGTLYLDIPKNQSPAIITVTKDDDVAYIRAERGLFHGQDEFDISGSSWVSEGFYTYGYMERDIYRPGEAMRLNIVVRDKKGRAPEPFPVKVKVMTPNGREWTTETALLTEFGTAEFVIKTTKAAPTGSWLFLVYTGNDFHSLNKEVYVEDFVAPRLFVEAKADKEKIIKEEKTGLDLSAEYSFGAAGAELPYEIKLITSPAVPAFSEYKDYSFTDEATEFSPTDKLLAQGKLNAEGKAHLTLANLLPVNQPATRLYVKTGVMEDSGRWVYRAKELVWYPSDTLIGIGRPDKTEPGEPAEISLVALTAEGKPAAAEEISYTLFRVAEREVRYELNGRKAWKKEEELLEREKGTVRLRNSTAAIKVTPSEAGRYLLKTEDKASGAKASRYISFYGTVSTETSAEKVRIYTDKPSYKTGDSASLTFITPFEGELLLTVNTNETVYHKTVKMKKKYKEIKIKVTEEMAPNAWVTAHIVRPAEEGREITRAYGTAEIKTDMSETKLAVALSSPQQLSPGKNTISVDVKNSRGKGERAEVTLMLVDETILGMTGYTTPDPWKSYAGKRELGVEIYDLYSLLITPDYGTRPLLTAGGGANDMEMKSTAGLSPVQAKRFKMLSMSEKVLTDKTGHAELTITVPEFSGKARLMAIAVTKEKSGSSEKAVEIGRETTIEPSLPRAMTTGDEITAPCLLYNKGEADTITLTVKAEGAVIYTGEKKTVVTLGKGETVKIPLTYTAGKPGTGKVTYTAKGKQNTLTSEIEIAVNPSAPKITETETHFTEPGKTTKAAVKGKWFEGSYKGTLSVSAMPEINLARLAHYLNTYPYGCTEQTISAAWTRIAVPELIAGKKGTTPAERASIKEDITKTLQKLAARQNYDGGFVKWQGESWSQQFETIYALHFMAEAEKEGIQIPEETYTSAKTYVRRILSSAPSDSESEREYKELLTRKAYACYVLALAGDEQLSWMEHLREKAKQLEPEGRLYLASAYAVTGGRKDAKALTGYTPSGITKATDSNYGSDLKNEALLMLALANIDPAGKEAAAQAAILTNKAEKAQYLNTQESAMTLLALSKYFTAQPEAGEPSGEIVINGKKAGEINSDNKTVIIEIKENDTIEIINKGKAKLFSATVNQGIPADQREIKTASNGIAIEAQLTGRKGQKVTEPEQGDYVIAEIAIAPTAGALNDVVAVIPLPGGFETENPCYTDKNEELPEGVRVEKRDDRTILFIDRLEKPLKWKLGVRAVTHGSFVVPAVTAECMYRPDVNGIYRENKKIKIK